MRRGRRGSLPSIKRPGAGTQGVNVTMGDGSVKFLKDSISLGVWRALSSTRGGEVISADAY